MSLEQRIEDFIMIMKISDNFWQINGTYHSIKATIKDFEKYNQPYNKNKINKALLKMEMQYQTWQKNMKKIEKKPEQKKREYSYAKILINELKNQKNK